MKIMLFFWAQEITNEILSVKKYLSIFDHQFILAPIIRLKDKLLYADPLNELSKNNKRIIVAPIYVRSPNSNFLNALNPNTLIHDFSAISKVIKKTRPNVIISFYIQHALPLLPLKRIFNFSLCPLAMGSDVNLDNSFFQKLAKQIVYQNSSLIFARSWKLRDKIREVNNRNVIVNPSSTDTSFFKPLNYKAELRAKWSINPSAKVVLSICRLDKNKAVDILLKSIAALENDDVRVLLVGDGEEKRALERLSLSLGIEDSVAFLGMRSKQEVLELYNLSDIFVLSSYAEGLPRVVLEAMACNCITIATDVGSVNALIANEYNGFITKPGDSLAISDYIQKISLMSEEELEKIRSRARTRVVENFDSQRVWQDLIESITTYAF